MKKTIGILLVLVSALALAASAVELKSLTVDGNYWFGSADNFFPFSGPAEFTHNSLNAAVVGNFSPGFVVGADYTYGKLSNPILKEGFSMLSEIGYIYQQQLLSVYAGYPYQLAPGFNVTASAGLSYYNNTQKLWDNDYPQDKLIYTIKGIKPQISLAAQYIITPQFSLRGNLGFFPGTGGQVYVNENIFGPRSINSETDGETMDICLEIFRWQLEGKYLIKPGMEAVAGYRVWDIKVSDPEEEGDPVALDSKGLYLGIRYSF